MKDVLARNFAFPRKFKLLCDAYYNMSNTAKDDVLLEAIKQIFDFLEDALISAPETIKADDENEIFTWINPVASTSSPHLNDPASFDAVAFDRAVRILECLKERGHIPSCLKLADIHSSYRIAPPPKYRRQTRALNLYNHATTSDNLQWAGFAYARLAELYSNHGSGNKNHIKAARKHAIKSARECNSLYGFFLLAQWYRDGIAFERNEEKYFYYLERAHTVLVDHWKENENLSFVRELHRDFYFEYGVALYEGRGCAPDKKRAAEQIITAYDMGHRQAVENYIKDKEYFVLAEYDDGCRVETKLQTTDKNYKSAPTPAPNPVAENKNGTFNPMENFVIQRRKGPEKIRKNRSEKIKSKKEIDKILKPLHALVGVKPVKNEIESLIYLAHANAIRMQKKVNVDVSVGMHASFLGTPGTGKTTVARMYGDILHQLGYLTQGHLVEATRADMIAEYIGQTAPRVRALVEKAKGGVLFIDEAYSIVPDDDARDFGPEAIAELMQQMENHRDDLVVIFAGYTDLMKKFLKSNPGLQSRVPHLIEFPDYSAGELVEIFKLFCKQAKFRISAEALERLESYLKRLDGETIRRMGNARGIRNIFDKSLLWQARRIIKEQKLSKKALATLEAVDIALPNDPGKGILRAIE